VVAADPDVRHLEPADRVDVRQLGHRAEVGAVAGVDDDVDAELLDDRLDDLVRRRVEVQVADVSTRSVPSSGTKVCSPLVTR
jgi:hypothetical protein